MFGKKLCHFTGIFVFCIYGLFFQVAQAAPFKVMVVMSCEKEFLWDREIRQSTDSLLANTCEIRYFYMNTQLDQGGGKQKAQEAYTLYQEFQPDGVIAVDDNAQSLFVVPYLRDKVGTPVMFCGVSAEPEIYGYPASNVSGILQRPHFNRSIIFAQQLIPSVRAIGFIMREGPSARMVQNQVLSESDTYPAKFVAFKMPKTIREAVAMTKTLRKQCDLLFIGGLNGIPGEDGKPLTQKEAVRILVKTFDKPTFGYNLADIKYGILCGIVERGQEQGRMAAKMLLKAMQGTSVHKMPITRSRRGERILNVTAMRALGVIPQPESLLGTELVKTEE